MSRLEPLPIEALPDGQRRSIERAAEMMGFVANDALTMARNPALTDAFSGLVGAVYATGKVDSGLKRLVGMMTSAAAGCVYCTGHTAFTSQRHGIVAAKLEAVWHFETSDQFTDAERAALRVAMHAGQIPNSVTDDMFEELGRYFDEDAQLEIVAVIAMFGFLNRWNSTLNTELEVAPRAVLDEVGQPDTGDE